MGYYDDCLEHHGILGQKWGVRRFQNANGTLTSAGKKRYTTDGNGDYQKVKKTASGGVETSKKKSNSEAETEEKKKGLSDKQKKALVAGAAVAGTALAAYGGYKLAKAIDKKATEGLVEKYKSESVKLMNSKYDAINRMTRWQKNATDFALERNKSSSVGVKDYAERARQDSLNTAAKAFKEYKDLSAKKGLIDTVAREQAFSKGEKVDYLKEKAAEKVNSIAKRDVIKPNTKNWVAGRLRSVSSTDNSEMPKIFTDAFTRGTVKAPSSVNNQKTSLQFQAGKLGDIGKTASASKSTFDNVFKMQGSTKFNQASKANDDYVSQLLKKNNKSLSQYSMKDLSKLDLY